MTAATIYRISIAAVLLLLALLSIHCWRVRYRRDLPDEATDRHSMWGGFVFFLTLCLWGSGANAQYQQRTYQLNPATGGTAAVNYFPFLFPTFDSTFLSADSSLASLRAYVSSGSAATVANQSTRLALEIVGSNEVWSQYPTVPAYSGSTAWVTITNGTPGATQPSSSAAYGSQAVWNEGGGTANQNYKAVYHLSETGSNSIIHDSSGSIINTSTQTWASTPGTIGTAGSFNGSGYAETSTFPSLQNLTVSVWIKPSSAAQTAYTTVIGQNGTIGGDPKNGGWKVQYGSPATTLTFEWEISSSVGNATTAFTLPSNAWSHLLITKSGSVATVYINGSGTATTGTSGTIYYQSAWPLTIAAWYYNHTRLFNGVLDEVRVSQVGRSASWAANEYASQSSPSTFLTLTGSSSHSWITLTDGSAYGDDVVLTDGSSLTPCTLTLSGGSGMVTGYGTSASSASLITGGSSLNASTVTAAGGTITLGTSAGSTTFTGTATTGVKLITSDGTLTNISVMKLTGGTMAGNLTITGGTAAAGTLVSGDGTTAITGGKFYGGTINLGASSYAGTITGSYSGGSTFAISASDLWAGVVVPSGAGSVTGSLTITASNLLNTATLHGTAGTYVPITDANKVLHTGTPFYGPGGTIDGNWYYSALDALHVRKGTTYGPSNASVGSYLKPAGP